MDRRVHRVILDCRDHVETRLLKTERQAARTGKQIDSYRTTDAGRGQRRIVLDHSGPPRQDIRAAGRRRALCERTETLAQATESNRRPKPSIKLAGDRYAHPGA